VPSLEDRLARWERERSFHHSAFPADRLAVERQRTVSVVIPTRECAATIGEIVTTIVSLKERGVVDQVLVVDAGSADDTAVIADRAGAQVVMEDELLTGFGPAKGKGDAMWRALTCVEHDTVLYLDGDSGGFGEHFVCGTLGPLLCVDGVEFVKAHFRRPFATGEGPSRPADGGRVTELTARPLLRRFWPVLAGIRQPLAGETAASTALLRRIPFSVGYAVETAMLLDIAGLVRLEGIAQVDLELRINDHQSLQALSRMADEVLAAAAVRLARDGRLQDPAIDDSIVTERPPMNDVLASA
jgi:glucosyl-3-phosphoglycerate synthase